MTTETAAGEMKTSNDRAKKKNKKKENKIEEKKNYKAHTQATGKINKIKIDDGQRRQRRRQTQLQLAGSTGQRCQKRW